jgi:hypothetical protein
MALLPGTTARSGFALLRGPARRLRTRFRGVGAAAFVALGFLAELGWAFFGSLGLRLGMRSGPVDGSAPLLWLAGAVCIGVLAGSAACLALPENGGGGRR